MRASPHRLLSLAVLGLLAACMHAPAQSPACSAADQKSGTCPTPAATTPAAPPASAGQKFPYPGSTADPDDPVATPAAPAAGPGKKFPYPGDPDPAASSSSSSSSSPSSASPDPDDPDTSPAPPAGRRKLPRPTHLQSDDERFTEDVKVAKFYHDDGNNLAAYNRLTDATKLVTDDPDAWFLLGDVAAKLHKSDESLTAYRKFLELEPNSRRAKNLQHDQPQLRAAR